MCSKCSECGINIIEKHPIVSQPVKIETECFEVEYDEDSNDFVLIVNGIKRKIGSCTTVMELYDIANNIRADK